MCRVDQFVKLQKADHSSDGSELWLQECKDTWGGGEGCVDFPD